MPDEATYTIQELFELLPIPIAELARQSVINEVTLARIRDGKSTRRSTINKLLITLSKIYGKDLTIRNVTGVNMQRLGKKEKEHRSPTHN